MPRYSRDQGPPEPVTKGLVKGRGPLPTVPPRKRPLPEPSTQHDNRGRVRLCVYLPEALRDRFVAEVANLEIDRGLLAEIALTAYLDELDRVAEDPSY